MAELSQSIAEIVRHEKSRVVAALMRGLGSVDAAEEALRGVFDARTLADLVRRRTTLRERANMYHI